MSRKTLVFEALTNVVNHATGEIVETSSTNVYKLPSEPPFVKMYLDDLFVFVNAAESLKTLLVHLLRRLDFEGYIILSARSRKDIASSLKIADQTFRNRLNDLCKKDLIRRVSTNEYQVNPKYFAKGDWKAVCAQRKAFQMRITYGPKGRNIETDTIPEQGDLPL